LSIVTNEHGVPEVVDSDGSENNVSVVHLVVVAHPGPDESPEGLDGWVSSESGGLLGLSA